jgi:hypothetical protein
VQPNQQLGGSNFRHLFFVEKIHKKVISPASLLCEYQLLYYEPDLVFLIIINLKARTGMLTSRVVGEGGMKKGRARLQHGLRFGGIRGMQETQGGKLYKKRPIIVEGY